MCTFPLHIIIHQTSSYSKPLSAGLHWQKVSVKYLKISQTGFSIIFKMEKIAI